MCVCSGKINQAKSRSSASRASSPGSGVSSVGKIASPNSTGRSYVPQRAGDLPKVGMEHLSNGRQFLQERSVRPVTIDPMSRTRLFLPTLVGVLALAFIPSASAAVGGFEGGDGDQDSSNCATTIDWACLGAGDYRAVPDIAPPGDDL